MSGLELFANQASTTVSSGGTTAPSAGTSETWTVASSSGFPSASSSANPPTFFRVADVASPGEKMIVTNVSGTTWTVTRGAEGTTPVTHSSGFTVQNVVTAAALEEFFQYGPAWESILAHGADPTGSADSSSAFNSAFSALPSEGGTVYVPRGTYKITSGIAMSLGSNQTVVIQGDGAQAVTLSYHGSGDCLRFHNALAFGSGGGTSWFSGIKGMTIDGANGTGSPVGIHAGDISFLQMRDVAVQNFTGTSSIGIHLDNTVTWTEECDIRAVVSNCTQGVALDVTTGFNSYGYSNLDLTFFQSGAQSCLCVINGAFLYHSAIRIRGDVNGSATTLTGNPAVIYVAGPGPTLSQASGGSPGITSSHFDILLEPNNQSGAATHFMQTFYLDTTNFGFVAECYGLLDFSSGSGSFAPISPAAMAGNGSNFTGFSGIIIGDSNLNASGNATWAVYGNGTMLSYLPQYTNFDGFFPTVLADAFFTTLDGSNSTVALNFSGAGNGDTFNAPQRKLLFIQQPSSGGPFGLTWPSTGSPSTATPTIVWPGGSPPVLQQTASAVDVIELVTYDGITWYGRQLQVPGTPVAEQFIALSTPYTLGTGTSLQKLFNASTNGAVTVAGTTAYFFECEFDLTALPTASTGISFGFGGTATLTSLKYTARTLKSAALTTPGAPQHVEGTAAAAQALWSSTATGLNTASCLIKGLVRINAGGTLIPEVAIGTSTTTAVVGTNSYFRLWPAGGGAVITSGPWS